MAATNQERFLEVAEKVIGSKRIRTVVELVWVIAVRPSNLLGDCPMHMSMPLSATLKHCPSVGSVSEGTNV